ncbi:glutamate--tRNA ligase [Maridesulfovibrio hydrothermalis]|uniref:Glutamate--tRNA ligase n=1 Tax=Maridesulfovibrio hydrothermalis AM13 = DSM 14728 TaxID=1121451 RepID=L0RAD5_9BACT|nr:glutamate--tRNA ligase [Maridesulfovibrio hydrothermalis]CCO22521.1 Glutamate--tRNA ligase [Maridesulfovibrio hydrothermalis AM13 = DSM 14728]
MSKTVTRFAPSPTGHLHIGGARTALFAWLLARRNDGRFVLRIEDTDRQRSTQEYTDAILESMKWLGMDWDGELVYQSERFDLYNGYIDQLLDEGKAYWCDCTPEQVDAMREKAMKEKRKPKYDGSCREKNIGPGENRVVRFKAPLEGRTSFTDMIKGPISVENAEMDDMILRRSDGSPTYNLAVVVDDHTMEVTEVLRGDDHVNNTPRQIQLYKALGWDVPRFGHVPMILGPDKKKLSKRHGALSVMEYQKMGYLPEAVVNYLVRLGWSHGDQEIFSREELVKLFNTESLGNSPSVFDTKKLDWVNSEYIKAKTPADLVSGMRSFLPEDVEAEDAYLEKMIPLLQPRATTFKEMADMADFFLVSAEVLEYDEKAVAKVFKPEALEILKELTARIEADAEFSHDSLEAICKGFLEEKELKFKAIGQPVRLALCGRTQSPGGLYDLMLVLGKDETLARLKRAAALV